VLRDGQSFRELGSWKGVSLWWFAEILLHQTTEAPRYVRLLERLDRALTAHAAEEVEVRDLPPDVTVLLFRLCRTRGIFFEGRVPRLWPRLVRAELKMRMAARLRTIGGALAALGRFPGGAASSRGAIVFLSHAGRSGAGAVTDDFDRVRHAVIEEQGPEAVAVETRRTRGGVRVALERWRAAAHCRRLWRSLRRTAGAHVSFSHRDVPFADLVAPGLARMMRLELPEVLGVYEDARAALESLRPAVLCLRNEAGGVGRATVAAAHAARIPTLVIPPDLLYSRVHRLLGGDEPRFEDVALGAGTSADAPRLVARIVRQTASPAPESDPAHTLVAAGCG
jgi:hypothetical protein